MKSFFLLSISVLSFLFISCQKEDVFYSCDPKVDAWTKDNLREIQSIDTESFRKYDTNYRLAIFNAISPEKRIIIWKEKINETLKLNWNKAESDHIKQLLTIINENIEWYESGVPENELNKYEIMAYRWADYSRKELGWNNELIAAIAASPLLLKNTDGELIVSPAKMGIRLKSEVEQCTCNPTVSFCSPCRYDPCDKKSFGCGLLGLGICNGLGC